MSVDKTQIGQYVIERLLSETQDALVYRVRDINSSLSCALKMANSAHGVKRIHNEMDILKRLSRINNLGDHVIKCLDTGQFDDMPYYVMPYLPQSLADVIDTSIPAKSLQPALALFQQIANAVSTLHRYDFVHGDLHPGNILIHGDVCTLIDFGNALFTKEQNPSEDLQYSAKQTGDAASEHVKYGWAVTPLYASPTQREGIIAPSIENDIYALAAMFCAVVSGEDHRALFSQDYLSSLNSMAHKEAQQSMQSHIQRAHEKWFTCEALSANTALLKAVKVGLQYFTDDDSVEPYTCVADLLSAIRSCIDNDLEPISTDDTSANHSATIEFQHDLEFSEDINAVKHEIETRLRQHEPIDHADLVKRYKLENTLSKPLDVINDLVKETQRGLSNEPEYRAFVSWSERLLAYKRKYSSRISKQGAARFVQQGLDEGAGEKAILHAWLKTHFTIGSSLPIHKMGLSVLGLGLLAIIIFWYPKTPSRYSADTDQPLAHADSQTVMHNNASAEATLNKQNASTSTEQLQNDSLNRSAADDAQANRFEYTIFDDLAQVSHTIVLNRVIIRPSVLPNTSTPQIGTAPLNTDSAVYVMSQEVSQGLWQACVNAGKCRQTKAVSTSAQRKSLFEADRPVVNVSWYDIQEDFIPFLNAQLGTQLSLPTMEQWLGFAYSFSGEPFIPKYVHCKDCRHPYNQYSDSTVPTTLLPAGEFGLLNVFGNAQEWLQDCWQDVKLKRERCDQAPAVGGSWMDDKYTIEQAPLSRLLKTARSTTTGFRLVKRDISD